MKKVLSILGLVLFLAFSAQSQTPPYVEFQKANFTLYEVEKVIPDNGSIRIITDNTDPSNIKTYIFFQRGVGTPAYIPNVPPDWSTYEAEYDAKTKLRFRTEGDVNYILTENFSVYLRIN